MIFPDSVKGHLHSKFTQTRNQAKPSLLNYSLISQQDFLSYSPPLSKIHLYLQPHFYVLVLEDP